MHATRSFFIKLFLVLLFLVAIAASVVAAYFFFQNRKLTAGSREIKQIRDQVAQVMELPNETPTLATVTEKEKLQTQQFFQHAENGDKALIFIEAKKAILYRPSIKKIIDVAPIQSLGGQESQQTALVQTGQATVTLLNGSKTVGLTTTVEKKLKDSYPTELTISQKTSASKTDYTTTLIVDLSGKYTELATKIAQTLHGTVGQLPDGEAKPNTDIVIILGQQ